MDGELEGGLGFCDGKQEAAIEIYPRGKEQLELAEAQPEDV